MASIYGNAEKAIDWLGLGADDSALALKTMGYTGLQVQVDPQLRNWEPTKDADPRFSLDAQVVPYSERELLAMQNLVARNWFKRLWVRQEVTLAKASIVVAGSQEISWKHFVSAIAFLNTLMRLRGNTDAQFSQDLFNIFECGCLEAYKGIMDILHACRACDCTEDQDRVYAILGLLSSHQNLVIQPDYSKKAKQVYEDLVMEFYNQHKNLDILALCEEAESPTWVPD